MSEFVQRRRLMKFTFTRAIMKLNKADDAEMLTSEVHDPYARTTGA